MPHHRRFIARVCLTALTGLALLAPTAHAASQQESMFQDDPLLVYAAPASVDHTLGILKSLGVDRVRVSVFWRIVAPAPTSQTRPAFDATDPAAYPAGAWDRYDTLVRLAARHDITVNFNPTSPAPSWATGTPDRVDIEETFDPNAEEFGQFVKALGTRYSGQYTPLFGTQIPRVNYWSIWNEPNQAGWLTPQWGGDPRTPGQQVETAPQIYRNLVDRAYAALVATGHEKDTILVGETAPKGLVDSKGQTKSMDPLRFIRQLYCLDDNLNFLQGTSAQVRGCPVTDQPAKFIAAHPGLFRTSGYAHHPYELIFAPNVKPKHPDWVTIANLPTLEKTLTKIYQRFGQPLPGGAKRMPIFLTEFGYQSSPPDPQAVTLRQQATYINQAEYIAWKNPTVKSVSQFLLVDDRPVAGAKGADKWRTFQSGIINYKDLSHKPAFNAYAMPMFLPRTRVGKSHKLQVWGGVRPAPAGKSATVRILVRNKNGKTYRTAAKVKTDAKRGYFLKTIKVRTSGVVRVSWKAGGGKTRYSRVSGFTVTG